jgi:peptide/nickel transport system ATP-binding protein
MTRATHTNPLLSVEGLSCVIQTPQARLKVLQDVGFSLDHSTSLGIVGESAAGKSMLIKALMGIAPRASTTTGTVRLAGTDLGSLPEARKRLFLGQKVGMVFQNPMTSLNPFVQVGRQVEEASRLHLNLRKSAARTLAIDLLRAVGIPDAEHCYKEFPHQFSGGMKQRIMIATALACEPELLIADEATTALDVTVQKEILDLLQSLQESRRMSMILVTHNLGIVAGRTDEVVVLYGGHVVEKGKTERLFRAPRHHYTAALLSAMPRMDQPPQTRLHTIPGRLPDLLSPEPGCPFAPRCTAAVAQCRQCMPPMTRSEAGGQEFACHVPIPVEGRAVRVHSDPTGASNA